MTTPLPDSQLCGCGERLTSEKKWAAHVDAGCTLAGMPRARCEAAAAERGAS